MRQRDRQSGFSTTVVLLAILVVAVLAVAGFAVFQHNRTKVTNAAAGSTQPTTKQPTTTTTTQPAPTVSYLTFKEWGVKIPLSSAISDAYYVADPTSKGSDGVTDQLYLGLASMDSYGCTAAGSIHGLSSAPAMIFRTLPGATDPVSGQLLTQKYPDGVTIGSYYYGYENLSTGSGNNCKAPAASLQSFNAAFSSAAKSAVVATAK